MLRFFRRKQNERGTVDTTTVDEESVDLWRSLETAGTNLCCHYMRALTESHNDPHIELTQEKEVIAKVRIKHCPECGRKLQHDR